jgi:hypothetical protein
MQCARSSIFNCNDGVQCLQAFASCCAGCHAGQVLERINGRSCSKVISNKSFNDVWYIRSMLKQTFEALDAAQRAYGYMSHAINFACYYTQTAEC